MSEIKPLEQFELKRLVEYEAFGGVDISFTNSSLFMVISVLAAAVFLLGGMRKNALVPGRWQSMAELSYEFIASMLKDTVGSGGRQYFPFIFTTFMYILMCNMTGMLPYSFTVTSHIMVTFGIAIFIFVAITIIGFAKHGLGYFGMFLPSGTPWFMIPLLIPIEVVSYLSRPISLSIRLAANMMAGHAILKVLGGFVVMMGAATGWLPIPFIVLLTGFEFLVAFLQAYIFTILVCVYLNDAIHMH